MASLRQRLRSRLVRSTSDVLTSRSVQADRRHRAIEQLNASKLFYERIISIGKNKHICSACNRGLDEDYLPTFERHVRTPIEDPARPGADSLLATVPEADS